jgi:molecular chaperone HscC
MIQRLVTTLLGRFPERSLDPDHAVALGVAIQAGLKERNQSLREVVLTDVAPYTLGIRVTRPSADRKTQRAVFAPIIERNTVVPVSREERFQTVEDGQTQIRVAVYQGESLLVEDNVFLDSIDIEVPQAPAGQQSVDVRFSYDVNGLLVVDVRSVSTGASRSAVIKGNASNLDEAELARCLERLAALKVHPRDDERNVALIHRAKRLYAASLGAERDAAGHALERFLAELDSQEQDRAQRARAELSRFLEAHDVWSREL